MNDSELVDHVLASLQKDFDSLEAKIADAKDDATVATLTNSKQRVGKTILGFLIFKGDPKFTKLGPKREQDLTRMLKEVAADLNEGKMQLMTYKDARRRKRRFMTQK